MELNCDTDLNFSMAKIWRDKNMGNLKEIKLLVSTDKGKRALI